MAKPMLNVNGKVFFSRQLAIEIVSSIAIYFNSKIDTSFALKRGC
jgi:hypothetical protein